MIDRVHAEMARVRRELEKRRELAPELHPLHQGWPWNGENSPFEWKPEEWSWDHNDWRLLSERVSTLCEHLLAARRSPRLAQSSRITASKRYERYE